MKTNKLKQTAKLVTKRTALLLAAILMGVMMPVGIAYADIFDDQINALQKEVSSYQDQAAALRAQANTLQNQLNALQAEKSVLQAQINANTVRLNQLNQQITETEQKIAQQQQVLSENLVNIYLDSSVTPLEVLASSSSIGDYIDKQEYRDTVRQQLQESIVQVKQLKEDLEEQKVAVQRTLADQAAQRDALAAKEAEQAELIAQTKGQENAYQQLAAQRNARIADLRNQQRLANLNWDGDVNYGSSCGGGYSGPWPHWCKAPLDRYVDNWGMYTRECVSYTAFKVWQSGRHMPYWGGRGNANEWDDNARAAGIPVDRNPRPGDVAVWHTGPYGHVMYVEAVQGNGDIYVSEYNFNWDGRYSERSISKSKWQAQGLVFIHF